MNIPKNIHKFYIQYCDANNVLVDGTKKDLEEDFEGLRYLKLTGYETTGKVKNAYTETYSDSNRLRVYVPSSPTFEATTLTLNLCFFGDNRYLTKEAFHQYIYNKIFRYWDTARDGYAVCICTDAVEVSEDNVKTDIPYISCNFKLTNIYGIKVKF